ncbi:hypothetical protein BBP40_008853 [Aspergillus hancockii]|nr:hypothetical protein BBP40_008853 [Aspergillus hancockii]
MRFAVWAGLTRPILLAAPAKMGLTPVARVLCAPDPLSLCQPRSTDGAADGAAPGGEATPAERLAALCAARVAAEAYTAATHARVVAARAAAAEAEEATAAALEAAEAAEA